MYVRLGLHDDDHYITKSSLKDPETGAQANVSVSDEIYGTAN